MSDRDNINDAYKKFASNLEDIEEDDKRQRKEILKKGIKALEYKYKEEIQSTHAIDDRLVKLRREAGMPELIGVGDRVEKSRFKDKKKFEQFLANEVLEIGIEETQTTGGIMRFKEFCKVFAEKRPYWEAPPKEIQIALEKLALAGVIPKLYKLKNKSILITFKPAELESDSLIIIGLVSGKGSTTLEEIQTLLGWTKERIELTLLSLVDNEIAYLDKKDNRYYFPSLK